MSEEVDDLDRALAVVWLSDTNGEFMRAREAVLVILAARVASAAAEAWDEGRAVGRADDPRVRAEPNPYRAVLAAAHDEGSEQR